MKKLNSMHKLDYGLMEPNVHRELNYNTNHGPNQKVCSVLHLTSETKPTSIGSFSKNKNYFDL